MRCIQCGCRTESFICDKCREGTDIENLCEKVLEFDENPISNKLLEYARHMTGVSNFLFQIIPVITEEEPSPHREYLRIRYVAGSGEKTIPNSWKPWFYNQYKICKYGFGLSSEEMSYIKGIMMEIMFDDGKYQQAERLALDLNKYEKLPPTIAPKLVDYYINTRRYNEAKEYLKRIKKIYGSTSYWVKELDRKITKQIKNRNKDEYVPSNLAVDGIEKQYYEFLEYLDAVAKGDVCKNELLPNDRAWNGKEQCDFMRQIRIDIAASNGIPYTPEPCTHEGDCSGSCLQCGKRLITGWI